MPATITQEAEERQNPRTAPLARAAVWVDRHPYLTIVALHALATGTASFLAFSAWGDVPSQSSERGFDPSMPWQANHFLFLLVAMIVANSPFILVPFVARKPSLGRITALLICAAMSVVTFIATLGVPSRNDQDAALAEWAQERYSITLTPDQVDSMRSGELLMIDGDIMAITEADDGRLYLTGDGVTNSERGE